jgi:hypothetical protein
MRRPALWTQAVLCTLIVVAVFVQVYLIASYIFGADSLDAHKTVGGITHIVEILAGLVGIYAWWGNGRMVGLSIALPVIGTIQVALASGHKYVGGLHGLLALFVFVIAGHLGHRAGRAAAAARTAAAPTDPVPGSPAQQ